MKRQFHYVYTSLLIFLLGLGAFGLGIYYGNIYLFVLSNPTIYVGARLFSYTNIYRG